MADATEIGVASRVDGNITTCGRGAGARQDDEAVITFKSRKRAKNAEGPKKKPKREPTRPSMPINNKKKIARPHPVQFASDAEREALKREAIDMIQNPPPTQQACATLYLKMMPHELHCNVADCDHEDPRQCVINHLETGNLLPIAHRVFNEPDLNEVQLTGAQAHNACRHAEDHTDNPFNLPYGVYFYVAPGSWLAENLRMLVDGQYTVWLCPYGCQIMWAKDDHSLRPRMATHLNNHGKPTLAQWEAMRDLREGAARHYIPGPRQYQMAPVKEMMVRNASDAEIRAALEALRATLFPPAPALAAPPKTAKKAAKKKVANATTLAVDRFASAPQLHVNLGKARREVINVSAQQHGNLAIGDGDMIGMGLLTLAIPMDVAYTPLHPSMPVPFDDDGRFVLQGVGEDDMELSHFQR